MITLAACGELARVDRKSRGREREEEDERNTERKKKEEEEEKGRKKKRFEVRDTRMLVRVHAQNVRACVSTTASMHDA